MPWRSLRSRECRAVRSADCRRTAPSSCRPGCDGHSRLLSGLAAGAVAAGVVGLDVAGGIVVERPAGLGVEARCPVQLVDILLAGDERAVDAVERIEEAVARGVHHELAVLAVHLGVDDRVLGDLVVVIGVVGRVLVAPLDLAVGRRDREHARGPFVVAGAVFRCPSPGRHCRCPGRRCRSRDRRSRSPRSRRRRASSDPAVLPGLVAGLAGARDRVGAPRRLAGVEVGRLDEAADAELAAGGADDGEVADDQRRDGQRLADRGIGDLALPHHFAGRLVDREHAPVERDRDDLVLPQARRRGC